MKRLAKLLLAGLGAIAFAPAFAAPDPTGLYSDPAHPGWGVGVWQQGSTLFGVLFSYDTAGAPVWYVASNLQPQGVNFDPCGSQSYSGALARTAWPGFAFTGATTSVQVQPVGTLDVRLNSTLPLNTGNCDRNGAVVSSVIDGNSNVSPVRRQTWSTDRARLAGSYAGGLSFGDPQAPCMDLNDYPYLPASQRQLSFAVSASEPEAVSIAWGTGSDTLCSISGSYSQQGQLGQVTGRLSCGPVGFIPLPLGPEIQVYDLSVSDAGFTGAFNLQMGSCRYLGTLAGARR